MTGNIVFKDANQAKTATKHRSAILVILSTDGEFIRFQITNNKIPPNPYSFFQF
jgi:hypothetical protein